MFDIPIWLFVFFVTLSFGLTAITFARDPKGPIFMMVAGIMIFAMVSLTDNITVAYFDRLKDSVTNSTTSKTTVTDPVTNQTISEIDSFSSTTNNGFETVPVNYPLTEWVKVLFGLYGTGLIFIGSLIYKREK